MRRTATALTVLVLVASIAPSTVVASIAPVTAGQTTSQTSGDAYAGTHVSFHASERAVSDYAVHGESMLDSVTVESQSSVEDGALVDVGASLSAVTRIEGAGLDLGATTETEARVEADNGATLTAHDNGHGILVVESGNQSDYVVANLSAGANASADDDSQVEVTTENGTEGTFLVVGEGNVTVNDDGDVTARLGEDGRLVFRAYPDGKADTDDEQERLIADGDAKTEAYVMAASESDGNESESEVGSENESETETETKNETETENANETEREGEDQNESESQQVVVDTVSYDDNTTVETAEAAAGEVAFTVNRTTPEGTILITSVSEKVLSTSEDLTVTVDGEAAVEAATYSQLQSAIGSEQSRYAVESAGSGSASADVLVAVNHFSERAVSMQSETPSDESGAETTDDGTTGDDAVTTNGDDTTDSDPTNGEDDDTTDGDGSDTDNDGGIPGFGVTAAVVALVGAALLARIR